MQKDIYQIITHYLEPGMDDAENLPEPKRGQELTGETFIILGRKINA